MMKPELENILADIEKLQTELQDKRKTARQLAISEAQRIITQMGIRPEELKFPREGEEAPRARRPVAPKYRGPNGETWTGRGRPPRWIVEATKDTGRTYDDFLINR